MNNPVATLVAALPGTLAELSGRTEYPAGQVLKFISHARREGHRIEAVMGQRTPDGVEPTIFRIKEVPIETGSV